MIKNAWQLKNLKLFIFCRNGKIFININKIARSTHHKGLHIYRLSSPNTSSLVGRGQQLAVGQSPDKTTGPVEIEKVSYNGGPNVRRSDYCLGKK